MSRSPESVTLWPRFVSLALVAAATFAISWLIGRVFDLGLNYPIAGALGSTVGYAFSQRATFSPTGLGMNRFFSSWDDVVVDQRRWGTSLRSRPGVERRRRVAVLLPAYLGDWRNHEVIDRVRTWAPHLDLPRTH